MRSRKTEEAVLILHFAVEHFRGGRVDSANKLVHNGGDEKRAAFPYITTYGSHATYNAV